jgi:hypothetical protein
MSMQMRIQNLDVVVQRGCKRVCHTQTHKEEGEFMPTSELLLRHTALPEKNVRIFQRA